MKYSYLSYSLLFGLCLSACGKADNGARTGGSFGGASGEGGAGSGTRSDSEEDEQEGSQLGKEACVEGCFIEGSCYPQGVKDPENSCYVCQPDAADDAWSLNDGAACDDGLFCTTRDTCESGECVGTARDCSDGIECTGVETCDEERDRCASTSTTCASGTLCSASQDSCVTTCSGCVIDGICFGEGQLNPLNPCEVCETAEDAAQWSAYAGSCGAGMQCGAGTCDGAACCLDVDECALDTDNCSADASCSNTEGGFECTCNPGFSGNGSYCIDDNECAAMASSCAPDATCSNTPGGFDCTCLPGFIGDGETCDDVDECALDLDNCHASAQCTNTSGSFSCSCLANEWGDGTVCGNGVLLTEVDQDIADDVTGNGCEGGELTNLSTSFIDIQGWSIVIYDGSATPFERYVVPVSTPLAPGETASFRENCGIRVTDFELSGNWGWWSRSGAVVVLNASDQVVDVAAFGDFDLSNISSPVSVPAAHWLGANVDLFHDASLAQPITWQRIGSSDSNSAADWAEQTNSWGAFNSNLVR